MSDDIVATIYVEDIDGELLVDSRLIAERLGIENRALRQTIEKYLTELQGFGVVTFEMSKPKTGRPERFAYLNEDQSIFLMTLSRNTSQVVSCKSQLVKAFKAAKVTKTPVVQPALPLSDLALKVAKNIRGINDYLPDHPRAAQILMDLAMNEVRVFSTPALPAPASPDPQRRGVAEIATEMGYKIDMSNRVKLGQFIKAQGFESVKDERFCNGVMAKINCYYDTPELRKAIAAFFEH